MSSPSKTHVHKYKRIYLGGRKVRIVDGKKTLTREGQYEVFKCMLPDCTTFKARELVIGNRSLCWKCGGELILDTENTKLRKPTHVNCRKIRIL